MVGMTEEMNLRKMNMYDCTETEAAEADEEEEVLLLPLLPASPSDAPLSWSTIFFITEAC